MVRVMRAGQMCFCALTSSKLRLGENGSVWNCLRASCACLRASARSRLRASRKDFVVGSSCLLREILRAEWLCLAASHLLHGRLIQRIWAWLVQYTPPFEVIEPGFNLANKLLLVFREQVFEVI